jgi:hypothetical protein
MKPKPKAAARSRLGKLVGMLGSAHAGERSNALDAIDQALERAGLSWWWVGELVAQGEVRDSNHLSARSESVTPFAHNDVRHTARTRSGTNGFRAWPVDDPAYPAAIYVACNCGWRPELGTHYRVDRGDDRA